MKITELMDNYTDNEVLIEGVQEADAEKVLQGVTARVKVKKHLRLRSKIIIAVAAVFIGLFVITAATQTTTFVTRLGYIEEWNVISGSSSGGDDYNVIDPYKIVDGRVIFTAVDEGEEEIDITDMFSDEKPFYYEYSKEDSNGRVFNCIIAVGGTPDALGYGEIFFPLADDGTVNWVASYARHVNFTYYLIDGKEVLSKDLTEEQYNIREKLPYRIETKPWVREFQAKGGFSEQEEDTSYYYPPGSN